MKKKKSEWINTCSDLHEKRLLYLVCICLLLYIFIAKSWVKCVEAEGAGELWEEADV